MRKLKDLLTNEEKIKLEEYEKKIEKASTPLGIFLNRRKADKLLKNAKTEYENGNR